MLSSESRCSVWDPTEEGIIAEMFLSLHPVRKNDFIRKTVIRGHLNLELEWLVHHYLDVAALGGNGQVDPYHQPLRHGAKPDAAVKLHARIE
jgi:hypothetical protein